MTCGEKPILQKLPAYLSGGAVVSLSESPSLFNFSLCLLRARKLPPSGTGAATFIQLDCKSSQYNEIFLVRRFFVSAVTILLGDSKYAS